jgi:hypothetical protein
VTAPADGWTPARLEAVFHAALSAGDLRGVDAALHVLAVRAPDRAQHLIDVTRTALHLARTARRTEGTEPMWPTNLSAPPAPVDDRPYHERPAPSPELVARLRDWHHPHFIAVEAMASGARYAYRPFTGDEPEPAEPADAVALRYGPWEGNREARDIAARIGDEVAAMRTMWKLARFHAAATDHLRRAQPAIAAWRTARANLDAAYAAVDTAPDGMWRATIASLVGARAGAYDAARAVDDLDAQYVELLEGLSERVHEGTRSLDELAAAAGLPPLEIGDLPEWGQSFAHDVEDRIRTQDAHIAEINRLAGAPADDD